MRLQIVGFRCYAEYDITFDDGMIILLKGPSGIGKSTIFQAIYWCLYGSLHHVYPTTSTSTTKCSVTLDIGSMRIYRQKRPERLIVMHQGANHEDDVAQEIINSMFGVKDVWMSCSYLQQGTRSPLLTMSNTDKMEILNRLSFSADDPEYYIAKIDSYINITQSEFQHIQTVFTTKQAQLTTECNTFSRDMTSANLDTTKKLPKEEIPKLAELIRNKRQCIVELGNQLAEHQRRLGMENALQEEKKLVLKQLELIPGVSSDEITNREKEVVVLTQQLSNETLLGEVRRLQGEMDITNTNLNRYEKSDGRIYTSDDLTNATLQQERYNKGMEITSRYGINYKGEDVTMKVRELQKILQDQPHLKSMEQVALLEKRIVEITNPDVKESEVISAREHLSRLQSTLSVLSCPSCY